MTVTKLSDKIDTLVSDFQLEHKCSYFIGLFPDLPLVASLILKGLKQTFYELDALGIGTLG